MGSASKNTDVLRLEDQMCFPLYAASNLLNRLYRPILEELGLTYPQYLVMLVLWERSPRTVGALGDKLFLDSGTLTPLLKRMEASGLVTRRRDPEDERRVQIDLTDKGEAMRADAACIPERLASETTLTIELAQTVRVAVRELIEVLNQSTHSAQPS
jgi:DNA-binding MarR family transcriptional regulator